MDTTSKNNNNSSNKTTANTKGKINTQKDYSCIHPDIREEIKFKNKRKYIIIILLIIILCKVMSCFQKRTIRRLNRNTPGVRSQSREAKFRLLLTEEMEVVKRDGVEFKRDLIFERLADTQKKDGRVSVS